MNLPEALTTRPATAADARAIVELIAACEVVDDGAVEIDEGDLTMGFGRQGFDPASDSTLVFDSEQLVAWAELYRGRAQADVQPSHRGLALGSALLAWIEDRARALGWPAVGQTKTDANRGARDLFLTNGYEAAWTSWILRIALDEALEPPEMPSRIAIRRFAAADAPRVHRLLDDAFSEWEGRDPEPYEIWAPQVIAHPRFRPDVSPLAFQGDELVGVVLSFDYPEHDEGWIMQLGTKASHRRRGIAQALLRTAFGWFDGLGRQVAGVSTDSRTGALGLYEKVGMRVDRRYTRYTKRLA